MHCTHCNEILIETAKICRSCGNDTPATVRRKRDRRWGAFYILTALVIGFVVLAIAITPRTYGDIAKDEENNCLLNKGYGSWTGSSGMTLDQFCKTAGRLKALQQERQDHPEKF